MKRTKVKVGTVFKTLKNVFSEAMPPIPSILRTASPPSRCSVENPAQEHPHTIPGKYAFRRRARLQVFRWPKHLLQAAHILTFVCRWLPGNICIGDAHAILSGLPGGECANTGTYGGTARAWRGAGPTSGLELRRRDDSHRGVVAPCNYRKTPLSMTLVQRGLQW